MNLVKLRATVEYQARQLAAAMDAADNAASKAERLKQEADDATEAAHQTVAAVDKARADLETAEAAYTTALSNAAQSNGAGAGGAALNATIRTEPNPD